NSTCWPSSPGIPGRCSPAPSCLSTCGAAPKAGRARPRSPSTCTGCAKSWARAVTAVQSCRPSAVSGTAWSRPMRANEVAADTVANDLVAADIVASDTGASFDLDHADSLDLLRRQTSVLELISAGTPLAEVLTCVAVALEELIEGSRCSIL